MLGRPYYEDSFRLFGSLGLRSLVDAWLAVTTEQERPVPQSETDVPSFPDGLRTVTPMDAWNWIRSWADEFVRKDDCLTRWGKEWMDYGLATVPKPNDLSPWVWRDMLFAWLRGEFVALCLQQWRDVELSEDEALKFWGDVWSRFLSQGGHRAPDGIDLGGQLRELASTPPRGPGILNGLSDGIHRLCDAAGIEPAGPGWAWFWNLPFLDAFSDEPQWATPLEAFGASAGKQLDWAVMKAYFQQNGPLERLARMVEVTRADLRKFEFWYPVVHYASADPDARQITETSRVVALTEGEAERLATASGVQGIAPPHAKDLFLVVTIIARGLEDAIAKARYEPENVLAYLRVADPRFRWMLGDYYYWTTAVDDQDVGFSIEWQDPYRLRPPIAPEYAESVHTMFRNIRKLGDDLAEAVVQAVYWQGIGYSQTTRQGELIAWWIPLERMGDGGFKASDVIGRIAGVLWHNALWAGVGVNHRAEGYQQDRERMKKLIHSIAKARNAVVHSGHAPANVDIDYVLWLMRHLSFELTELLTHLLQEGVKSFGHLQRWLDAIEQV